MSAAAAAAELDAVQRRLRVLQKRVTRMHKRTAPSCQLDIESNAFGLEADEGLALKVSPASQRILVAFVRADRDATSAGRFLDSENKLDVSSNKYLRKRLSVAVEDAYLTAPFHVIVNLLDPPNCFQQCRELFLAGRYVAQCKLYSWLLAENKKGVAPGRKQLVAEAVRCTPSALPAVVVEKLHQYWRGGGRPRSQRKWLRQFRSEFGLRLGRVRMQSVIPVEEMQRKAGVGLCPL